jgi:hypothetical protein
MDYESGLRFLGLPLLHVATGRVENGRYRRGIARGWVAVGDIAFGASSRWVAWPSARSASAVSLSAGSPWPDRRSD